MTTAVQSRLLARADAAVRANEACKAAGNDLDAACHALIESLEECGYSFADIVKMIRRPPNKQERIY